MKHYFFNRKSLMIGIDMLQITNERKSQFSMYENLVNQEGCNSWVMVKKEIIKRTPPETEVLKIIEAYIMQRAERASDSSPIH